MTETTITMAPDGSLINPDFHDGYLRGVVVSDKTVTLYLQTHLEEEYVLEMPGLAQLWSTNFMQGNIILDVMVFPATECPREFVDLAHNLVSAKEKAGYGQLLSKQFLQHNGTCLVVLPSYGCELYATSTLPLSALRLRRVENQRMRNAQTPASPADEL